MKTYHQERAEKLMKRAVEQFDAGSPELQNVMKNFTDEAPAPEPEAKKKSTAGRPPQRKRQARKRRVK